MGRGLRPLHKGGRLINAGNQRDEALQACEDQTNRRCHQWATRKGLGLTWIRMQPSVRDVGCRHGIP